jgi:hypothetical protein
MNYMDTLPSTSPSQGIPNTPGSSFVPVAGSMAKEVAPITTTTAEIPTVTEAGKETELSPEVVKAGVKMSSDSVVLPKIVQQMGVHVVGPQAPVPAEAAAISLPLSDEQIAKGLHQSILTSWRWLSEWCKRQLLQAHLTIKSMHGKTVRAHE